MLNTALDVGLFLLLHPSLGVVAANAVSTTVGTASSLVLNGRVTFGAERLTLRAVGRFLATNALTMWLVSPAVVAAVLAVAHVAVLAKIVAVAVCMLLNYTAYRLLVWPDPGADAEPEPGVSAPAPPP